MEYSHRFTRAFRSFRHDLSRAADRLARHLRHSDPWAVVGWAIGGIVLAAVLLPVLATLAVAALLVALLLGWLHEFVFLMGLGDESFPGRHDKLAWIALFVLLPPVGAVAFWMYRHACWPVSKSGPWSGDPDSLA
jgi:hypothetical protein